MPSIAGIIQKGDSPQFATTLHRMVESMRHEEFYSSGRLAIEGMRVNLGWVCHKGSFNDCLPIWNETKDICLIFNGEEFTDDAAIQALRQKGHQFDARNATYLVHLYEEMGPRFVEKLNGWFSGLLVDCREGKILLFNDRYGLSRVYYHDTPDAFYFSSEAKALLRILPSTREINLQALGELLSCGCPLSDRTLFRDISVIPKGSLWTFSRSNGVSRSAYFQRETWENQEPLDTAAYNESMVATFSRILPRYFRGQTSIGMSLTGGVDSRMIMAWAKSAPQALSCFTFGGMYRESTDVRMARQIAKICHQRHEVIPVGGGFFSQFPELAEKSVFVSDGMMDVSGSVEFYVNRLAREISPIRLTGSYGGEILRGLVAFKPTTASNDVLHRDMLPYVTQAAETYSHEIRDRRLSFVAFKQVPWYHYARLAIEQSQLTVRSPFLDNDLVSLAYRAPEQSGPDKDSAFQIIAGGNPALAGIETDRGLRWQKSSLISRFRHIYQQFTFKSEYAYDYGMPQWLARLDHVVAPMHFEKLFLGRHKFYHFRVWYRDVLANYVQAVLLDDRALSRPYLNRGRVEEMVRAHVRGTANHTLAIHKLLTCELIYRTLIEGN